MFYKPRAAEGKMNLDKYNQLINEEYEIFQDKDAMKERLREW